MGNQYAAEERRRFRRVNVNFTVFYRVNSPLTIRMMVGDRQVNAIALDLSEGGIAVLTDYNIPKATIVRIRFIMLDDGQISVDKKSRSIEVEGEVRYNMPAKEQTYRLGICFLNLSADDCSFINNFVKAEG